jgi:serine/threonine protein kinase
LDQRWAQVENLFHRVLECDPSRRAALLDEACSDDTKLRKEVEALLSFEASARDHVQAAVRSEIAEFGFLLEENDIVSHYRILGALGGGGMGLVYSAEDIKLGRRVALKFLPEESAKDPAALARFEHEARAASRLEHPNICPIYEFGEHDGQPFLVMQLLEGKTLRELLEESRRSASNSGSSEKRRNQTALPLRQVLDMAIQIADGLNAAHQKGIIHRDIKPANIFITRVGQTKILDFGLAKLAPGATDALDATEGNPHIADGGPQSKRSDSATPDPFLSRTGVAMGTAGYMSPEQARGEKLDTRTDLFSFGVVLYEMATGRRAFAGDTGPVLHAAILGETPIPVRQLNPDLPIAIQSIVNKAIEKDRSARYQTAAEVRTELQSLQHKLAPKHLPGAWVAGLIAVAIIALGSILFILNKPPKTVYVAPEIRLRQLTTNSDENPVFGGVISPNGKYLAYSDARGIHLKLTGSGETRTVAQPEGLKNGRVKWAVVAWFPDNVRFLANSYRPIEEGDEWSSATANLWTVSVSGVAPTKLRDHAFGCAVSPDGSAISFAANRGKLGEREIWLMGANGEEATKIYEAKDGTGTDCWIWSPDGSHYLYVARDESGDRGFSQKVAGSLPVTVLGPSELQKSNDIVWLHDGRVVYDQREVSTDACNYWITRFDLDSGKRLEEPRRLTNWPNFCVSSGSVSSDDKHLVFEQFSDFCTSYISDLQGEGSRIRNVKQFTFNGDCAVGWSSDSRAVIVGQTRGDTYRPFRQSLDSDTPEPLAPVMAGDLYGLGTMTPDGNWHIFQIWPKEVGTQQVSFPLATIRVPTDGGPAETILRTSLPAMVSCARLPFKTCVIAEKTEDRKQMIVSSFDPLKGRGPELARFDLGQDLDSFLIGIICQVSPDGERLAVARTSEGPIEIYTLGAQLMGKVPTHSPFKLVWLTWAADQKGLFITGKVGNGDELSYADLKGNTKSLRRCVGDNNCFGFPSPDGRHLAITDRNHSTNMWMMENF